MIHTNGQNRFGSLEWVFLMECFSNASLYHYYIMWKRKETKTNQKTEEAKGREGREREREIVHSAQSRSVCVCVYSLSEMVISKSWLFI